MTDSKIGETEKEIRDLQKELAEVRKERAALRLRPCLGDKEIREKDGKLEDLDIRAKTIDRTLQDLQRKRQRLISESILKGSSSSNLSMESILIR